MSTSDNPEQIVLQIAEEFLSKKTFFSIQDIANYINNRVKRNPNINLNRIEKTLKSLIKKKVIIPGTKLMKFNILDNEARNEIYKFIKKNPAMNINDIMRDLDLGSNQALWHLSTLEKFQLIRSKKKGNQRIFFKFDSDSDNDDLIYYMRNDTVKDIINLMKKEKKSFKISEIVKSLSIHYNTAKKYLKSMIKLNLIDKIGTNGRSVYKLNFKKYANAKEVLSNE